jgi:hypothetical protein
MVPCRVALFSSESLRATDLPTEVLVDEGVEVGFAIASMRSATLGPVVGFVGADVSVVFVLEETGVLGEFGIPDGLEPFVPPEPDAMGVLYNMP